MSVPLGTYALLMTAIAFETMATSILPKTEQFTRPLPTAIMALGYIVSFYCLSIVVKHMPVGVAYAIWCGLGIVLVAAIGLVVYNQHLDGPAYLGLGLIIAGVLVVNLFSKTLSHS